jgi:hypothetical protein
MIVTGLTCIFIVSLLDLLDSLDSEHEKPTSYFSRWAIGITRQQAGLLNHVGTLG